MAIPGRGAGGVCHVAMVERGDQDPVGGVGGVDRREDGRQERRVSLGERLQLDVDRPVEVAGQLQGLGEARHADGARREPVAGGRPRGRRACRSGLPSGEGRRGRGTTSRRRACGSRPSRTRPRGSRRRARGSRREPSCDVGRPEQGFVVDDHRNAVAAEVDVELPGERPGGMPEAGGFERVLGRVGRVAPMRDDNRRPRTDPFAEAVQRERRVRVVRPMAPPSGPRLLTVRAGCA